MKNAEIQQQDRFANKVYLQIWKAEQEYMKTRWSISTFFISISFAIFGFSFQGNLSLHEALAIRIAGLLIYWFSYLIFLHLYRYAKFLRAYLIEMETSHQTSLSIQGKIEASLHTAKYKRSSSTKLLVYFGIIFTIGNILLWILGI